MDLNQPKLPPGTHTLYVRAEGPVKYLRNPVGLKAAEEARQKAEKAAADAVAAAKDAGEKLAVAKKGADAKSQEAEKQTQAATKAAADAGPKDTPAVVYSAPIVVKVIAPVAAPAAK